jgi:hypothetical protein
MLKQISPDEGVRLLRGFLQIEDAEMRASIIDLVEQAAKSCKPSS